MFLLNGFQGYHTPQGYPASLDDRFGDKLTHFERVFDRVWRKDAEIRREDLRILGVDGIARGYYCM
jgi:hypothetical protein